MFGHSQCSQFEMISQCFEKFKKYKDIYLSLFQRRNMVLSIQETLVLVAYLTRIEGKQQDRNYLMIQLMVTVNKAHNAQSY